MISEFAQNDFNVRQGEEGFINLQQAIASNQDSTLMTKPGKGALYNVAQPIPMRTRVFPKLRTATTRSSIDSLRDARHHPASPKILSESRTVIGAIRQDTTGTSPTSSPTTPPHGNFGEDPSLQLQFVDVGRLQNEADGRSSSVGENFSLSPLSDLHDSDTAAAFLAAAKLASRIPCDNFNRLRLPNKTLNTRGQTPSFCQRISLNQQVGGEPYSRGMSFQRQPVLKTKRMPLRVLRSSIRHRLRRFFRGSNSLINFQSFADKSVSRMRASFLGVEAIA